MQFIVQKRTKGVQKMNTYKPTNREKKLKSKTGKFWCDHCDMALVGHWEKCPVCKQRSEPKRLKKDSSS